MKVLAEPKRTTLELAQLALLGRPSRYAES